MRFGKISLNLLWKKLDVQPDEFAGKSSAEKRADIAKWLKEEGLDATVIAALDSVAWAFNIRGKDISNTPVPRSYAIVRSDGSSDLFVAPEKLTDDVFGCTWVTRFAYAVTTNSAPHWCEFSDKKMGIDPERSVAAIFEQLGGAGAHIVKKRDPTVLAKAIKNDAEVSGHKAAQARDGAALTRFLHWFSENALNDQDELSVAAKLAEFRGQSDKLMDLSFRTISGAGPNGALCHYSVNEETNRPIEDGTLYLVDSGGQYRDGTTDVTRTMAVGEPTAEMIKRYTQVLQGHIALAQAAFPKGTTGGQLDILARQYLWADGV